MFLENEKTTTYVINDIVHYLFYKLRTENNKVLEKSFEFTDIPLTPLL